MNEQRRRPMATGALGRFSRLSRGFTLIEMLISVALVLLMMVLFAEIFGLASESMTLQQAIADGDQQVRSFTTVFRSDIQKRTFQTLVPFDNQEDPELAGVPFSDRQGYLYISLNDPENATDNLLQFTVRSTIVDENSDDTEYFGKSTGIVQQNPAIAPGIASQNVRRNRQQPEHDDGDLSNNFTASSSAAEIAYFMRAGRLYRRVVLIREPLISSGTNSAQPQLTWDDSAGGGPLATPKEYLRHNDFSGAALVQTIGGQYLKYDPVAGFIPSDDYWLDFDHGAYQSIAEVPPRGSGTIVIDGANMVGVSQLDNARSGAGNQALGLKLTPTFGTDPAGGPTTFYFVPRCIRFGFDQATGISREFSHASPSVPGFSFLGRFTLEEMSHPRFNFPQNPAIDSGGAVIGNPVSYASFPAAVDAGLFPNGAVDEFEGGSRRGQDLLLSNVHEFDIDIWDDSLGAFVKLGHQLSWSEDRNNNGALDSGEDVNGNGSIDTFPGDYHRFRNNQLQAGLVDVPGDSVAWSAGQFGRWTGRTFDTWHRDSDLDGDLTTRADRVPPPYRAMTYYPPTSPSGPYASRGVWQTSTGGSPTNYVRGDIVFPTGTRDPDFVSSDPKDYSFYYVCIDAGTSLPTEDVNGNGVIDTEDTNGNDMLDPGEDVNGNLILDTEDLNGNDLIDTNEPVWPAIDRALVERSFPGSGEPRWVARRNVKPLRAIRIRVRFFHESSGRMRQVSLVHSLVDEDRF
jgi:prepilin-type N-terminal cleavage/methylation domain-containing protein